MYWLKKILPFYLGLNLQKNNKSRKSKKEQKELITSTKVVAYLKLMGLQIVVNLDATAIT